MKSFFGKAVMRNENSLFPFTTSLDTFYRARWDECAAFILFAMSQVVLTADERSAWNGCNEQILTFRKPIKRGILPLYSSSNITHNFKACKLNSLC